MLPPDSSGIDTALLGRLANDAALRALLPDGVWFDTGPPNMRRFAILSVVISNDIAQFGRRAIESTIYRVKAVMLMQAGVPGGDIQAAALRIDELLEDAPIAAPGYGWMTCFREERLRETEVDEHDATILWQHRGGLYRLQMALT